MNFKILKIITICLLSHFIKGQKSLDLTKSKYGHQKQKCEQNWKALGDCEFFSDFKNSLKVMSGTVCFVTRKLDSTMCYLISVKLSNNLMFYALYSDYDKSDEMPLDMVSISSYNEQYGQPAENSFTCSWIEKKKLFPKNNIFTQEVTINQKYKLIIEGNMITKFIVIGQGTIKLNSSSDRCCSVID